MVLFVFFILIIELIQDLIYRNKIYVAAYLAALMPGHNDECEIHSIILEKLRVPYPPPPKKI